MGVNAKTEMIKDISDIMINRFEKVTFSVLIPRAFDDMKGKDVNFEMVASNTLQPLRLIYSHNIVTRSIATIFVHTECKTFSMRELLGDFGDHTTIRLKEIPKRHCIR